MKILTKKHKYPQFRAELVIVFSSEGSVKQIWEEYKKKHKYFRENTEDFGEDVIVGHAAAVTTSLDRVIYVFLNNQSALSDIHHESIHVTAALFNFIDTRFSAETEETFAYTSTMVFEQIHKFFSKNSN